MRRSEWHIALMSAALLCGANAWADPGATADSPSTDASAEASANATPGMPTEPVDPQGSLPDEAKDLRIDEKVGQTIALDVPFVDDQGTEVSLASYVQQDGDGLPIILTFNYSSCPMLCNSQLNGLIDAMEKANLLPGQHYRVITVAIDHRESTEQIATTKAKYVREFSEEMRERVARGWTFLRGSESDIRALSDSAGFPFRYLEDDDEFAHPASLIFLSPTGVITRYYHGIYYEPDVFDRSIFQAGAGEHGVSVGFLLACLTPSHQEGYAKAGVAVMRYGALGFVLLLLAAFGTWQVMRTRSARQEQIG